MKNSIVIIGFMGCGKTTLSKKIASKLNLQFIDSDSEIEQITGKSVQEIFEQHGENYFRELEKEFIESLTNKPNFVLSTGGGMPCFNDNMKKLNEIGTTFYLKLSPYELSQRLLKAKKIRPLISNKTEEELYQFVKEKLNDRKTYYEMAKFILNGKEQNHKKIMELI